MRRHLWMLRLFWGASIGAEMEYRANFVMAALASGGMLGGSIFGLSLFYQNDYTMGSWTWHQVLIVLGLYTLLDGVQLSLLAPNRQRVTEYVREGTLDFILLKPVDSQFLVSVRAVSLWGLPNLALGAGLVVYGGIGHAGAVPWLGLARGTVPLVFAVVLLYSIGFALGTLTIWFVKLWNVTIAMEALLEAGRYPIRAYAPGYRLFFTFVIPVVFLTTVPAEAITGDLTWPWLVALIALSTSMLVVSRRFWWFALRFYTSASS